MQELGVPLETSNLLMLIFLFPQEKGKCVLYSRRRKYRPQSHQGLFSRRGNLLLWKGESANSLPTPSWSTDSGKLPKPISFIWNREKGSLLSTIQSGYQLLRNPSLLSLPAQVVLHGRFLRLLLLRLHPHPIHINSQAPSQSKQESKQADSPHLSSRGSRVDLKEQLPVTFIFSLCERDLDAAL